MNFLNPWFLLGSLAAAVPVIFHLIRRDQARRIEFPTLMFLRKISKKTIRFQKLRHLLLLIARVLVMLLLALVFMRPYQASTAGSASRDAGSTARVILLDNSMSMGYGDRWKQARDAAARLIRDAGAGELVALVEFSDKARVLSIPSIDRKALLALLDSSIALSDRATRYGQALRIAEQLAVESGRPHRLIHLISDFQRNGISSEESSLRLRPGTELRFVDVGSEEFSNLAITQAEIRASGEGEKALLSLQCSLANFGNRDFKSVRVWMSLEEKPLSEKRVDLDKGKTETIRFEVPAPPPGRRALSVNVEDSSLPRDNRRLLLWEGRGATPVLGVESPQRSSSFFLSRAISPGPASRYRLELLTPASLGARTRWDVPAIVWNDVQLQNSALSRRLEEFVSGGGGLLVLCTDNSWAADFDRSFGAWLPVRLRAGAADSSRRPGGGYPLMTHVSLDHPIFQAFRGPGSGTFSGARFYRHAEMEITPPAEILARFDSGSPALAAVKHGGGQVLVFAGAVDSNGSDLPLKAVFAPFLQEMMRFLDRTAEYKASHEVGETVSGRELLGRLSSIGGAGSGGGSALAVLDPDRQRLPLEKGQDRFAIEKTGIYEIRSAGEDVLLAANPAPRESDLTHGNAEEMTAAWAAPSAPSPPQAGDTDDSAQEVRQRRQFWSYILMAMALLFLVEGFFANRFFIGADGSSEQA